jgi:quercetin dioxygenase-like cupin family protein
VQNSLKRIFIASALFASTSLGVFGCTQKQEDVTSKKPLIETLVSAKQSWNGDVYQYPEGQAQISLQRITVPAGFRTPVHTHPQPGVAYVIKGTLECIAKADQTLIAEPGDSFATTFGDVPHYCENISKEEGVVMVTYAGVVDQPVTLPVK